MSFAPLFKFETELAKYTGAPYVILTDGCTHALELCFRYEKVKHTRFTAYTYLSVPMLMYHLGIKFELTNQEWEGEYQFFGTRIWDSARRLEPGMYRPGQIQCLSFGWTKPLQLGKVGAILTDDSELYKVCSRLRSDGRDLNVPWESESEVLLGYHYCPTLESCVRGSELLSQVTPQRQKVQYPDCRKIKLAL